MFSYPKNDWYEPVVFQIYDKNPLKRKSTVNPIVLKKIYNSW